MFSTIIETFCGDFTSFSALIKGGLNFSFSQTQPQPPDNGTIQNIVEDYVNEYVGRYTVACNMSENFGKKALFITR